MSNPWTKWLVGVALERVLHVGHIRRRHTA